MPKPWITLTVMASSNKTRLGIGIRANGPARRKGREGPFIKDFSETLEGIERGTERAVLRALEHAQTEGWEPIRIRVKDRGIHKRLKKLLKGPAAECDDLLTDILQRASSFEEVAMRVIPRGKGLQSRYLAREAAGLPRFKGQSDKSDGESWFCLGWEAEELDILDDSDPAIELFEAMPDADIPF